MQQELFVIPGIWRWAVDELGKVRPVIPVLSPFASSYDFPQSVHRIASFCCKPPSRVSLCQRKL